jgi:hypothetical protein
MISCPRTLVPRARCVRGKTVCDRVSTTRRAVAVGRPRDLDRRQAMGLTGTPLSFRVPGDRRIADRPLAVGLFRRHTTSACPRNRSSWFAEVQHSDQQGPTKSSANGTNNQKTWCDWQPQAIPPKVSGWPFRGAACGPLLRRSGCPTTGTVIIMTAKIVLMTVVACRLFRARGPKRLSALCLKTLTGNDLLREAQPRPGEKTRFGTGLVCSLFEASPASFQDR